MSAGYRIILKSFASAGAMSRCSFVDPDAIFVDVKGQKSFARRGHVVVLPPDQRKCLLFLLCSPHGCTSGELANLLWAERCDGGPESATNQVRGYMSAVSVAAAALGFAVDAAGKGRPWRARRVE